MMAAGSSTVPLNEQLLTKALMTIVGLGRGGSPRGEADESTEPLIYGCCPHYSAPQRLNKSPLNYIEVLHFITSLQGYIR